jgi:hypothetical protein
MRSDQGGGLPAGERGLFGDLPEFGWVSGSAGGLSWAGCWAQPLTCSPTLCGSRSRSASRASSSAAAGEGVALHALAIVPQAHLGAARRATRGPPSGTA